MRTTLLTVLAVVLLGAGPQDDAAKKDLEKLQGTWTMTELEVEGAPVPPEKFTKATLVIKGDRYTVSTGKETYEVALKLDPSKDPKEIDMRFLDGPNKDQVGRGIYEIGKDTFKVCRGLLPEHQRPIHFVTGPKSSHFVVVWRRQS